MAEVRMTEVERDDDPGRPDAVVDMSTQKHYTLDAGIAIAAIRGFLMPIPMEEVSSNRNDNVPFEKFETRQYRRYQGESRVPIRNDPYPLNKFGTISIELWKMDDILKANGSASWGTFSNLMMALEPAVRACAKEAEQKFPEKYKEALEKYSEMASRVEASSIPMPSYYPAEIRCFNRMRITAQSSPTPQLLDANHTVVTWFANPLSTGIDGVTIRKVTPKIDVPAITDFVGVKSGLVMEVDGEDSLGTEPFDGEFYQLELYLPDD